jgi:hypothetical protein
MLTAGNTCWTTSSPRPRARMYGDLDSGIGADAGDPHEAGDAGNRGLLCERRQVSH